MRSQKTTPPATALNLIEVDLRKDPTASTALEVLLPGGAIVRISHESQITYSNSSCANSHAKLHLTRQSLDLP